MAEQITPEAQIAAEPELTKPLVEPRGVLQKNIKAFVFLGACALVIVAALFSAACKNNPSQTAATTQPPQPIVQYNTDRNVTDLKNQIAAARLKEGQPSAIAP